MAGKSTLISQSVPRCSLAHIGMGVPAATMRLRCSWAGQQYQRSGQYRPQGKSYFFNEVQRIQTIEKINGGHKWLVLIDELFKGTNVQDAMKCSLHGDQGSHQDQNSLFILSPICTEIGEDLRHTRISASGILKRRSAMSSCISATS